MTQCHLPAEIMADDDHGHRHRSRGDHFGAIMPTADVGPFMRTTKRPRDTSDAACVPWVGTTDKKSSSLRKRQERDTLAELVSELETQIDELRRRAGLPTREDQAAIQAQRAQSADFERQIHANNLHLGRAHSLLTKELMDPVVNPLSTFIHLPRDMAQRRAILHSIQGVKLRRGVQVATQRLRYLDHSVPYLSEEFFTTAGGEYHCIRQAIHQFPNFKTARQLLDTYVHLLDNMEMSVTEGLGQMTLREDDQEIADPTIWNHRVVTVAEDVGCTEELNIVGFAQFYNHSQETQSPMGVVVVDVVNVDDLYPYRPHERTCRDIQIVCMAYELRTPGCDHPIVVFKEVAFIVLLPPQFEVDPGALRQLQRNCTKWAGYIIKCLHEFVVVD